MRQILQILKLNILIIFFTNTLLGQPEILWERHDYQHRRVKDALLTADGGLLIMGYYDIFDSPDTYHYDYQIHSQLAWLMKTDSLGTMQWEYLSDLPDESFFDAATELSGKRYIVSGSKNDKEDDPDNAWDGFYFVFDSTGVVIHEDYFSNSSLDERVFDVLVIDSTSFLLLSYRYVITPDDENSEYADYYWEVSKIDAITFNIIWQKEYHPLWSGLPRKLEKDDDGNFYIIGSSFGFYGADISKAYDYWVIKVDSTGEMIWRKRYGQKYNDKVQDAKWFSEYQKLLIWGNGPKGYSSNLDWQDIYTISISPDGTRCDSLYYRYYYKYFNNVSKVSTFLNDSFIIHVYNDYDTDHVYWEDWINSYCIDLFLTIKAKLFSISGEELGHYPMNLFIFPQKIIPLPNNEFFIVGFWYQNDTCFDDYIVPAIVKIKWPPP